MDRIIDGAGPPSRVVEVKDLRAAQRVPTIPRSRMNQRRTDTRPRNATPLRNRSGTRPTNWRPWRCRSWRRR